MTILGTKNIFGEYESFGKVNLNKEQIEKYKKLMNNGEKLNNIKITVVGLGYIGLPIALAFSKYFDVIGYDINKDRINKLKSGKRYYK